MNWFTKWFRKAKEFTSDMLETDLYETAEKIQ